MTGASRTIGAERVVAASPAYRYMDALRFVAASLVVLGHVRNLLIQDFDAARHGLAASAFYLVSGFGHQSVIIFFVLSGYWITGSVVRRANQPRFWTSYLIDRVARLGIVLFPVLLIGAALDLVGIHAISAEFYAGATGANSLPAGVRQSLTPLVALGNLAFLQTIAVPVLGSNGPLWSLAYEFWYYLFFPALLFGARGRITLGLLALVVALLHPALLWGFLCWLCGSALWFAEPYLVRRAERAAALGPALLVAGAGASLALLVLGRISGADGLDLPLALAVAVMLAGIVTARPPWPAALDPIARYGATGSYSLYAIHYPLVALLAALLTASRGRLVLDAAALVAVGGCLLAALAAGYGLSRVTEANTGRLRHALRHILLPQRVSG